MTPTEKVDSAKAKAQAKLDGYFAGIRKDAQDFPANYESLDDDTIVLQFFSYGNQ